MWSLSKSRRRRHDRWEIALAKWGPKAASKIQSAEGMEYTSPCHYFQVIGHYPFIYLFIGSWLVCTTHLCFIKNRAANSFYNKMWFINLFFWGETKLVWTKAEVIRPERKSIQLILWKVPKEFVIFEAACSLPDTPLAVLKSTVMLMQRQQN